MGKNEDTEMHMSTLISEWTMYTSEVHLRIYIEKSNINWIK